MNEPMPYELPLLAAMSLPPILKPSIAMAEALAPSVPLGHKGQLKPKQK
jgi:hypothetical protein